MEIVNRGPDEALKRRMEEEHEKYESRHGVVFGYAPFCLTAEENGEVLGAVTGFTCYAEVYIDDLVVMEAHRGKQVGARLLRAVEDRYRDAGLDNINLCTSGFQAPGFYEKCGFQLEFVRKNRSDSRLDKYFYVKYF